MTMRYTFNEEDLGSSALSTPRSGLRTPPTSPLWSTGSAITTPGSSGSIEHDHCQADAFQPGSPAQAKRYRGDKAFQSNDSKPPEIERKRNAFFASIRETVLPLLGADDSPEMLCGMEESIHAEVTNYVLLDSQPTGIRGALKPYQLEGLSKMIYWRNNGIGGILADDMGLGKTLQALSLFQYVKNNERADIKFLVVCPLSVLSTWMSEISRWTTGLRAMAYHGSSEERESLRRCFRQPGSEPLDIVVTTYETLCSDLWFFQKTIWANVVLDEGHHIKNSKSKRTQGVYRLRSEYKIVLTGTPIQNNLTELWSILHWLYPDVFVPATAEIFENAFSLTDGKFDSIFLNHVTGFLKIVMLRRTKCDSQIGLDLPPKKETVFSVPLTELQLGWYRKILTGMDESILLGSIEQGDSQPGGVPMTDSMVGSLMESWETDRATGAKNRSYITTNTLMELRKCSIHPYLLADALPEEYHIGQHVVDASGKFIVLQKMIRQYVGLEKKKIIIFSGFDQTLDLCEDLLEVEKAQFSFKHVRLDGSTSSAWRNLSVFLFQNDLRYMVFLLSTRAGGEGLNLVCSSTVIFLDDDWNPQVMRQAESRVHRIGQTQPVQIFRMHAKGTVEDQMRRRINKKAYLADKVMGELGDDITHHMDWEEMDLEESTEEEICLIPSRSVVPRSFDAKDLANSDFHSIMSSCALEEVSVQEMSHAEKRAWLARAERVKTNIFNGVMVETKSRRFSVYDETVLSISKASRRIGKSRVVTVGEWKVSKESMEMAIPVSPTFTKQGVQDKAPKVNDAVSTSSPILAKVMSYCLRRVFCATVKSRSNVKPAPGRSTSSASTPRIWTMLLKAEA
ncbi:SNF2 family N-terminal domain-containing protein [Aspergillus terricola var. indicus]